MTTALAEPALSEADLLSFQGEIERELERRLCTSDEVAIDPRWARASAEMKALALRPGKRVRPLLARCGYALARGELSRSEGLLAFAAGLELLHTFMLVHDDVADRAPTRRGGPALQHLLGGGRHGDDLAVVLGDHLYARSLEVMLGCGLPRAAEATSYMLGVCRHTAAGQYLDLELTRTPLSEVTVFQAIKVATLKTARYGFVAPLVSGAMLGGALSPLLDALERVGRQLGLAYQLKDDLLGLFGDEALTGKDSGADYLEGKRTFPVVAAWTRADGAGRARLEALWSERRPEALADARAEVRRWGGHAATARAVTRLTRSARRGLVALPPGGGARALIDQLGAQLAKRVS